MPAFLIRDPHTLVVSCARSRPLAGVSRVPTLVLQIPGRDWLESARNGISPLAWNPEVWSPNVFQSEHGCTESATNDLRKQWRRGIPYLLHLNEAIPLDSPIHRKALKA